MTCNKDCANCMYGKIVIQGMRCTGHNVTCTGECRTCSYGVITSYRYKCERFKPVSV